MAVKQAGWGEGLMGDHATAIDEAVRALERGAAVVFPTDTVYGIGVAVAHAAGPDVIYRIKERDRGKPIAWLVGSVDDLARYGRDVPSLAFDLAHAFWPGALTLIVRASDAVPAAFRSSAGTIGLRMPQHDLALALVRAAACPLATSSANKAGRPAPGAFDELDPALVAEVPCVLRGSVPASGVASTVLDCTGSHPRVVRAGGVSAAMLRAYGACEA